MWAAVEARRPRVPSVAATLSAYERDRDRAGFLLAGALAYRLFLWLLPFTLVIVGGLGFLEASSHDKPSDLADNLGVVGLASKSVSEAAADADHARYAGAGRGRGPRPVLALVQGCRRPLPGGPRRDQGVPAGARAGGGCPRRSGPEQAADRAGMPRHHRGLLRRHGRRYRNPPRVPRPR